MYKIPKKYSCDDLYKALKKWDREILKNYNCAEVSDEDYFFYGINSDIVSNALNILTNFLSDNINSNGIDLSCRTILEALVILEMNKKGVITKNQKRIYRYLYAYVDLDNFHSIIKDFPRASEDETIKRLELDKEKAKQAMLAHFGCTEKDLSDWKISTDDPCFYLKTKLKDDIRFTNLLKKYPLDDRNIAKSYEFFSIFLHPRCEMDLKFEEELTKIRRVHIELILDYVYNYLQSYNLLEYDENELDFNHDFFSNPQCISSIHNIREVEKMFNLIEEQLCNLPTGYDAFTYQFLEKLRYLIADIMISLTLGYNEHVIACFKVFIEEYSIFYEIGSVQSQEEFDNMKKAYWITSRVQVEDHFLKYGVKNFLLTSENEIKELYENYYKDKYKMNNYDSFRVELRRNSLFFLSKERRSFNKHVRISIESMFADNEKQSKDVMTLYRISKDMCHASGYNFNATAGMVHMNAHKTLYYIFLLIDYFVRYASETLTIHGIKNNVDFIILFLKKLMDVHKNEVKRICNEQIEKKLRWKNQKNK